jgi:hypothetical protein
MFRKAIVAFGVLTSVVSALALSGGAFAAKGGNSANAKLCQKGGWQHLMDASGSAFASQDQCVGYGASGGAIYALARIEVTATDPQPAPDGFSVSTSGFGLEPTTLVTTTILKNGQLDKFESLFVDGNGEVNGLPFGSFSAPCVSGNEYPATATGTSADSLSKPTAPGIAITSNTVARSSSCP